VPAQYFQQHKEDCEKKRRLIFLPTVLAFALSLSATLTTATPIAVDYYFHLEVAKTWGIIEAGAR